MARPKLPRASRKARTIIFRISEAGYLQLSQAAAQANMSIGAFVRELALSRKASVRIETIEVVDPALLKRLDRLGNLLNQLTARANVTGRVPPSVEGLCEQIAEIVIEAAERSWKDDP